MLHDENIVYIIYINVYLNHVTRVKRSDVILIASRARPSCALIGRLRKQGSVYIPSVTPPLNQPSTARLPQIRFRHMTSGTSGSISVSAVYLFCLGDLMKNSRWSHWIPAANGLLAYHAIPS